MFLCFKIILLLWSINLVPPLLAHFLLEKWDTPVDRGRLFYDGRPLLGSHKTIRGLVGGVAIGTVAGISLGFPYWLGFLCGVLSMVGDLTTSFLKRRLGKASGSTIPAFDQMLEGALPFIVVGPFFSITIWHFFLVLILFSVGAYAGSWFLNHILLGKPFEAYPRSLDPKVRFRELRACQILANPLHHFINFEDSIYYHLLMKTFFRVLGVYEKGKQNALKLRKNHLTFTFPDLPPAFDGYTILFLTDLHLDGLDGLTEQLGEVMGNITVDLCIVGGDLRMGTHGPFDEAILRFKSLLPHIDAKDGIYCVLGNHDCTEMIEPLQEAGVTVLLNDAVAISRNGDRLWVVGVDDPHYYRCHDLEVAFEGVPPEAFTIFVAHSNECYRDAVQYSPQIYLCGHSHAGQIQLPWIGAVFTHSRAPRRLCCGKWHHGGMVGYTSAGVGVSGVPVRFASYGEVTHITLRRSASASAKDWESIYDGIKMVPRIEAAEGRRN